MPWTKLDDGTVVHVRLSKFGKNEEIALSDHDKEVILDFKKQLEEFAVTGDKRVFLDRANNTIKPDLQ